MLEAGAHFGDYRIESTLGRGGMGIVYRATHRVIGRTVALKLMLDELSDDDAFRERFLRESRITASIEHPNVIPIYDAGERDGRLFIAMRFVQGTDLARVLEAGSGGLDHERAVRIVLQVAAALQAAHQRGLVHRDVKPANVLVDEPGGGHVYLSDFGLTRLVEGGTNLTALGDFVGTVAYCAPEQINGEPVDAAADVYALGCVLFHMLTGQRPYERESEMAVMFAQVNAPVPDVRAIAPAVAGPLAAVVSRALAKSPGARFASAEELACAAAAAAPAGPSRWEEPLASTPAALPSSAGEPFSVAGLLGPARARRAVDVALYAAGTAAFAGAGYVVTQTIG